MTDPVIKHFDITSEEFDSIYSGKKGFISRKLDHILRWDMYERLRKTVEVVQAHSKCTVLDIGAGSGRFFMPMLKAGASHIVAVEPAAGMVKAAKALVKENQVEDKVTIIEEAFLDWKKGIPCEVTIAIGLYDYLDNPLDYMKRTYSLTNKVTVASFPIKGTLRAHIRKIRLGLQNCPVFYYTVSEVEDLARKAGFASWDISQFGQLIFLVAKR